MDIERELERVVEKHKGREVGTFETRVDLMAEDCLREIRELKEDQRRNNQKMKELAVAYGELYAENENLKESAEAMKAIVFDQTNKWVRDIAKKEQLKATLNTLEEYCRWRAAENMEVEASAILTHILSLIDRKDD